MSKQLETELAKEQEHINQRLLHSVEAIPAPTRLKNSILYSIRAGGKRIRPILMKWSCESFHGDTEKVYPAAIALEMIHTYSLIHDDLPAMDDDTYRRGQYTNHKMFDEATAILAGDGLLTNSFQIIANSSIYSDKEKVFLIEKLSAFSGMSGMVGGQTLDMESEKRDITLRELEEIHHMKTGRLLSYAIQAGSFLAGTDDKTLEVIDQFAGYAGLIFQIQDDILDVVGDAKTLGKQIGKDAENDKNTYPKILGLQGAIQQKQQYVEKAKTCLSQIGLQSTKLETFIDYISDRNT
ncbi:polyprenyl diphosphate synthase [Gracilibacillus halophilus YIM-C55.5]|uniref:Farnesyl diphosphate synthase n=1 Tax=Gracilibacillus halophilus YIM-C55.5 TaxID=1308866 RepID=N4WMN5_9BACI|nr:farnesyl diphosphate synthase [Gracilibacillus halophilus]ENH97427.1 polyprenyl diphosphate synthase [Gracilibacillus halophilus YIM-C55.5]